MPDDSDPELETYHITKMKELAIMYVWLPGINYDIEKSVRHCSHCQKVPLVAPLEMAN